MDWGDSYALRVRPGQRLTVTSSAETVGADDVSCWWVMGPDDTRITPTSTGNLWSCELGSAPPTDLVLEQGGTYRIERWSHLPHGYTFSMALTG